jgi:uncharacterized membrane protein YjjP (DUF1212 family)
MKESLQRRHGQSGRALHGTGTESSELEKQAERLAAEIKELNGDAASRIV